MRANPNPNPNPNPHPHPNPNSTPRRQCELHPSALLRLANPSTNPDPNRNPNPNCGPNRNTVALTCLGCEWVEARHPVQALSTSPCDLRNETVWEVQVGLDEYNPNPYALTLTLTR